MVFNSTSIHSSGGSININGKEYKHIYGAVNITDNGIYVNGKPIEEYKEPVTVKLIVQGNVESIEAESSEVNVEGDAGSIVSKNGNITIKGNAKGNVESKNGNIIVRGTVAGDVSTKNGNIIN